MKLINTIILKSQKSQVIDEYMMFIATMLNLDLANH